jgi:uncharacterized protein YigA (DUF484 family)
MKTVFTPYARLIENPLRFDENKRMNMHMRMRENLASQKVMIAQFQFEIERREDEYLSESMAPIMADAQTQYQETIKIYEQSLALFN